MEIKKCANLQQIRSERVNVSHYFSVCSTRARKRGEGEGRGGGGRGRAVGKIRIAGSRDYVCGTAGPYG